MRILLLLILIFLCACSSDSPPALNKTILEVLGEYPTDGSFAYYWPKPGSPEARWEGTTTDVVYDGTKLTSGDSKNRSYCCGLTFEVYVKALLRANGGPVNGVSASDLHETRLRFFGDSEKTRERRRLVQFAFESMKLGTPIPNLEEAQAGDFVQFWRHSGSGHSAIFLEWIRTDGAITGIKYWSTQGSTKGIATNVESIGPKGVKQDEIYIARAAARPRP